MKINIAIIGASGYTGAELIRLLLTHPSTNISVLTGDSQAGKEISEVYPHLIFKGLPKLISIEQADFSKIDLVFCCLPHGTTQKVIAGLPKHVRIIDLSADFRLHNVETYAKWYGHAHEAVELQKTAIYGLTEHAREKIRNARLVANPGCYPTGAIALIRPLVDAGIVPADWPLTVNAVSGYSGGGKSMIESYEVSKTAPSFELYGLGLEHKHVPELIAYGHLERRPIFVPSVGNFKQGMLVSVPIHLDGLPGKPRIKDIEAALAKHYTGSDNVRVIANAASQTRLEAETLNDTDKLELFVFGKDALNHALLVARLDNLGKGAAGAAVQNLQLMLGLI